MSYSPKAKIGWLNLGSTYLVSKTNVLFIEWSIVLKKCTLNSYNRTYDFHYHISLKYLVDHFSLMVHCGALCLLFVRLFVLHTFFFFLFEGQRCFVLRSLLYVMCKASFHYLLMNVHIQFPRHNKAVSASKPLVYFVAIQEIWWNRYSWITTK